MFEYDYVMRYTPTVATQVADFNNWATTQICQNNIRPAVPVTTPAHIQKVYNDKLEYERYGCEEVPLEKSLNYIRKINPKLLKAIHIDIAGKVTAANKKKRKVEYKMVLELPETIPAWKFNNLPGFFPLRRCWETIRYKSLEMLIKRTPSNVSDVDGKTLDWDIFYAACKSKCTIVCMIDDEEVGELCEVELLDGNGG